MLSTLEREDPSLGLSALVDIFGPRPHFWRVFVIIYAHDALLSSARDLGNNSYLLS